MKDLNMNSGLLDLRDAVARGIVHGLNIDVMREVLLQHIEVSADISEPVMEQHGSDVESIRLLVAPFLARSLSDEEALCVRDELLWTGLCQKSRERVIRSPSLSGVVDGRLASFKAARALVAHLLSPLPHTGDAGLSRNVNARLALVVLGMRAIDGRQRTVALEHNHLAMVMGDSKATASRTLAHVREMKLVRAIDPRRGSPSKFQVADPQAHRTAQLADHLPTVFAIAAGTRGDPLADAIGCYTHGSWRQGSPFSHKHWLLMLLDHIGADVATFGYRAPVARRLRTELQKADRSVQTAASLLPTPGSGPVDVARPTATPSPEVVLTKNALQQLLDRHPIPRDETGRVPWLDSFRMYQRSYGLPLEARLKLSKLLHARLTRNPHYVRTDLASTIAQIAFEIPDDE